MVKTSTPSWTIVIFDIFVLFVCCNLAKWRRMPADAASLLCGRSIRRRVLYRQRVRDVGRQLQTGFTVEQKEPETFNVAELWDVASPWWKLKSPRQSHVFCVLFKLMGGQNNIWRVAPARMLRNCPPFFPTSIPFRALVSAVTGGQLLTPREAVATNKPAAPTVLAFLITTCSPELTGFQCWHF